MTLRFETPRIIPVQAVLNTQPAHTVIQHQWSNDTVHCFTIKVLFAKDLFCAGIELGKLTLAVQAGVQQL